MPKPNHADAEQYLAEIGKKVSHIARDAHELLLNNGCSSYVKTIYIGYDFDGQMIAALYAHADHVEVAIALSVSFESELLVDATHLTWRTLPVAAILRSKQDVVKFGDLVNKACEGVRSGSHSINRDNDYFTNAKRLRRNQP
jgi:hypothetical protein